MKQAASPVKQLAIDRGLSVFQPSGLRNNPEAVEKIKAGRPDVMVVAAYGLIIPQAILDIPRLGAINIHASILPRWRGAAPIQRAILSGDAETGITLMQMDSGLDTGGTILFRKTPILDEDTTATLHDRLARLGAEAITDLLSRDTEESYRSEAQLEEQACYAAKITKSESVVDWNKPAEIIVRMVRAYDPFPGTSFTCGETAIKIWKAKRLTAMQGKPGEVLRSDRNGIVVACGQDAISIEMLQKAGGKKLDAESFLSGFPIHRGALLN